MNMAMWFLVVLLWESVDAQPGRWCSQAYDSNCFEQTFSASGWTGCVGYSSCVRASVTMVGNSAECSASHACEDASFELHSNSDVIMYCKALYSCLSSVIKMNDIDGYYDATSKTTILCNADQACLNSDMTAQYIECTGDRSCANSNVKLKNSIEFSGHGSGINSIIECYNSSTNQCTFDFEGFMSGYNASIICNNKYTCNINCYGNGCYGLTVLCDNNNSNENCTNINKDCTHTFDNDFCNNLGYYYYPSDLYPILNDFNLTYLIDINTENSMMNTPLNSIITVDSIFTNFSTNYATEVASCNHSSQTCQNEESCLSDYYIRLSKDDYYSGICCQGRRTCCWNWMAFIDDQDSIVSNDNSLFENNTYYTFLRCDGHYACGDSFTQWSDWVDTFANISNPYTMYIYLSGYQAYPLTYNATSLLQTYTYGYYNEEIIYQIFVAGQLSASYGDIGATHGGNIYCVAKEACIHSKLYKIANVYAYGVRSYFNSEIESVANNVYCIAPYACANTKIKNVDYKFTESKNNNIYAFGIAAAKNSIIRTVQGSIIGFGFESLYGSSMDNIGDYLICIGNNTCENAIVNGVAKGIIAYGINTLSGSMINTNYNDSSDANLNVTIRINGENDILFNITCNTNDYCNLYCESQFACTNLIFICTRHHCNIECNDYDCPVFMEVDTPNPTVHPTHAPSDTPIVSPTVAPSVAPSMNPTLAPTAVPTIQDYCDSSIQTNDTYLACQFLTGIIELNPNNVVVSFDDELSLRASDYCSLTSVFNNKYFKCFENNNNNKTIKEIILNNTGIVNQTLTTELINFIPSNVVSLDLSNNGFVGTIEDWSLLTEKLENLETLKLNNNQFEGTIDLSSLSTLDNIKYINLGNNKFTSIDNLNNLESMYNLEELYIEMNEIFLRLTLSSLPQNGKFSILHCYNNSFYGNLIINHVPVTMVEFICGNNDFNELDWTYDSNSNDYYEYSLEYIDISNGNLDGTLNMSVFDANNDDCEFINLLYVILDDNPALTINIDVEYLSGSNVKYFSMLNVGTDGECDFSYLTSFIVVKLDVACKCVSSYCENNNHQTITWYRNNDTCVGSDKCEATCECVTPYAAGMDSYVDSGFITSMVIILCVVIGIFMIILIASYYYSHGYFTIPHGRFKRRDDFDYRACLSYLFQLWDFFSDILVCVNIWDHYYQETSDNPVKSVYLLFFILSVFFVIVPWSINLLFLLKSKRGWQQGWIEDDSTINKMTIDVNAEAYTYDENRPALLHAQYYTIHWLTQHATLLVALCMLSGGLSASLNLVNSKLFGLTQFNMGLPKYKQDESTRHRLWLVVLLENIPQIIITILYASVLGTFNSAILFSLISSVSSVILAIVSIKLTFPKHYYIYELKCILKKDDSKLLSKLRQTKSIGLSICQGMHQEFGYIYVENVYRIKDAFSNVIIVMNVIGHEKIAAIDSGMELDIMEKLDTRAGILCDTIEFFYIKHECVHLLTLQDLINYFCKNSMNNQLDKHTRIISMRSLSPSGAATPVTYMPNPSGSTDRNNNNNNNNKSINSDGDDENKSSDYVNWSNDDVCQWFEKILLAKDEFKDKKNEIEKFKMSLTKQMINGKLIKKMIENEKYFDAILEKLLTQTDCAALVLEFEESIKNECQ